MSTTPPDVSQLDVESPERQIELQNASQAMTPQVQAPQPSGNPSVIKSMLSNFFQGFGAAAMKHAGLETPQEQQQRQFNQNIAQQNANSLQGLRDAQIAANQFTPVQLSDGNTVNIRNADMGKYAQAVTAAQARQKPTITVTPEISKLHPELQGLIGQDIDQSKFLDLLTRKSVANIQAQNKRPSAAARDDRYIDLQGRDPSTWTQDDKNFMKGYEKFVDFTKIQPGVQRTKVLTAPRWAALDPDLQARQAMAKSLASGTYGNQLTSFNAFVGHLGDFHDAAQQLKNTDYKLYNTAINRIAQETGDPRIQGIIAKIEPVRKEFESLLLNNRALYEADRKSADVILNQNSSPAQIEEAVKSLAGTAAIRLGAVNSSVKRVIGEDIPEIVEPANGTILEELGAQIPGYRDMGQNFQGAFKNPLSPNTRPGGGSSFKLPPGAPAAPAQDGKVLRFAGKVVAKSQGGKWVAP